MLFCPSRRPPERQPNDPKQARGDYAFCGGGQLPGGSWSFIHSDLSATKSNGMFVQPRLEPGGAIWKKPGQLTFAQVTDGLSNTIAVGEKRVEEFRDANNQLIDGASAGTIDGPQYRWGFHSSRGTRSPMNGPVTSAFGDYDANFGSKHPGGCNFLLGDGSVRFLPETINYDVYNILAARNSGKPVSLP